MLDVKEMVMIVVGNLLQVTHLIGVLGFGGFCFVLGASELNNSCLDFSYKLMIFSVMIWFYDWFICQ